MKASYHTSWLLLSLVGLLGAGQPSPRKAALRLPIQAAPVTLFGSYTYLSYAILDRESSPEPIAAQGVGGTLTLRPNGTYQKRLTLTANGGAMRFDQDGRFTSAPGRISFSYTDKQGRPRTDEGHFQFSEGHFTLTVAGFPAGNQSIYTLRRLSN